MKRLLWRRPSPAMVVAVIALVMASSGTSYAVRKANVSATQVDGLSAVKASTSTRRAAGRLVATERRGANRGRFHPRHMPTVARSLRADRAEVAERAGTAGTATSATTATTATSATSATSAATAGTVGGRTAAQLTDACAAGSVDAGSLCFESAVRAATTPVLAFRTCAQAGGVVPQAAELLGAQSAGQITLAAEEWSGTVVDGGATPYLTVNSFGPASTFGAANTQPYRCAFAPRNAR